MPKRSIYLQPTDNLYRRTRHDLEFLCNYWDRLLTSNQSYDIRLPELLRANHLMRHLSSLSLPSNQGLRVNVSFTILDDGNRLEPEETYQLDARGNIRPHSTQSRNGFHRTLCNNNAARHNVLLRNYIRQINENYAVIERELMRARILAPLIERDRFAGCPSAFYNQRAATCNWNKFPTGNRTCSERISPELQERHVNPRERNNRQACALSGHECCIADRMNIYGCSQNQQPARQKENSPEKLNNSPRTVKEYSPRTSAFNATVQKLQLNNNNYAGTSLAQNNNGTIKKRSSKESMEACQGVSEIINDAVKTSDSAESRPVKPVAINNSDKRSIDPVSCQGNVLLQTAESGVATDQNIAGQGRGNKRKLDVLEDRAIAVDLEAGSQQNWPRLTERIEPRVKDTLTTFTPDEKVVRSRLRNSRMPTEGKPFWKRHVSTPKYASFLRMFHKEETDNQLRGNSSSRRNEREKSQYRRRLSAESSNTDRDNRANPRIERRTPTPRSTVHTTYNPIIHSSATDPTLDSSGLTIQLLRLAVLLYAPTLMPALNSLIAQQNQQTPVSTSSAFKGSNDLLIQIFRLLNEQQSIPNLPFVSIGSERASTALTVETNGESSRTLSVEEEENTSITLEKSDPVSKQGSISAGKSGWKSNNHVQQQNGKNKKWRLTSLLTDFGVRLNRNIFTAEDFRKFEEFLKAEKKRPEEVRSLSTKSKNEIVMKEYFRNWLHRLLRQLNSASSNLSMNVEERGCPEGSSRTTESSLEEVGQRNRDCLISDELLNCSRDDVNTFSEREEEDSDDQKSFTSVTSTNSSRSLQFKQDDAIVAEKEEKLPRNENSQD
ncbi:PREDICTED: uncharacterized protein LOC108757842 isoform X2 [Trachymyrmex cornetzi]|uniref:uncharacterized protein LOC108757842 isoform X2 n=1 Tax=Trachymyrmex cornetzi TaxID=471704 RepID=UPI00084F5091|nr:PREDICTED: uncharacterized protein LOC108757842 isoform X2 [Trachymyrmex cornetzi]